jgi:hypothetical protein
MIKDESVKFGWCLNEFINVLYPIGMLLINEKIASSSTRDPITDNCSNNALNV